MKHGFLVPGGIHLFAPKPTESNKRKMNKLSDRFMRMAEAGVTSFLGLMLTISVLIDVYNQGSWDTIVITILVFYLTMIITFNVFEKWMSEDARLRRLAKKHGVIALVLTIFIYAFAFFTLYIPVIPYTWVGPVFLSIYGVSLLYIVYLTFYMYKPEVREKK